MDNPTDKHEGCTCSHCGQLYKVDLMVPDEWWARISPKPKHRIQSTLLCGECIMRRIETSSEYSAYRLTPIDADDRSLFTGRLGRLSDGQLSRAIVACIQEQDAACVGEEKDA